MAIDLDDCLNAPMELKCACPASHNHIHLWLFTNIALFCNIRRQLSESLQQVQATKAAGWTLGKISATLDVRQRWARCTHSRALKIDEILTFLRPNTDNFVKYSMRIPNPPKPKFFIRRHLRYCGNGSPRSHFLGLSITSLPTLDVYKLHINVATCPEW